MLCSTHSVHIPTDWFHIVSSFAFFVAILCILILLIFCIFRYVGFKLCPSHDVYFCLIRYFVWVWFCRRKICGLPSKFICLCHSDEILHCNFLLASVHLALHISSMYIIDMYSIGSYMKTLMIFAIHFINVYHSILIGNWYIMQFF